MRLKTFISIAIASLSGCFHVGVVAMTPEEWKQRSIYQLLTDRFATSDGSRPYCNPQDRTYCGGTFRGIISKLDYIQEMGFDAVWISPVTAQLKEATDYGEAYHGFWQTDMYSINPRFGTSDDLVALSNALHVRGMALMVDVVVNHMGSSYLVDYSKYTPFNDRKYYHKDKFVTNYDNQTDIEQSWLGNGQVPLPDLNTEDPVVVATLNSWAAQLVQKYKIDGLRLDTVKHIRADFWPAFVSASGVYCIGEVLSGDPHYVSKYQSTMPGLLDYPTYYPILRSFAAGGDMSELVSLSTTFRSLYRDVTLLGTFMENHDMPRFPVTNSDLAVIKNALGYTMLSDGIPIIYYGQEQGFAGTGDPGSREALWLGAGYDRNSVLYMYISLLNRLRKAVYGAGFSSSLASPLYGSATVGVWQKGPLLSVLSNMGSKSPTMKVSFKSLFAAGTVLVDVMECSSLTVRSNGLVNTTVVQGLPRFYVPQELVETTGLCAGREITVPPSTSLSRFMSVFSFSSTSRSRSSMTQTAQSTQTTWSTNTGAQWQSSTVGNPMSTSLSLSPARGSTADSYSIFSPSPSITSSPTAGTIGPARFTSLRLDGPTPTSPSSSSSSSSGINANNNASVGKPTSASVPTMHSGGPETREAGDSLISPVTTPSSQDAKQTFRSSIKSNDRQDKSSTGTMVSTGRQSAPIGTVGTPRYTSINTR